MRQAETDRIRDKIIQANVDDPEKYGWTDEDDGPYRGFGELLCYEIHVRGLTFKRLAIKWDITLPMLGHLIADHCRRLVE